MGYLTLPPDIKKVTKFHLSYILTEGQMLKIDLVSTLRYKFTTRGYGVLQINYRGPVGFGLKENKTQQINNGLLLCMMIFLMVYFWANDKAM